MTYVGAFVYAEPMLYVSLMGRSLRLKNLMTAAVKS